MYVVESDGIFDSIEYVIPPRTKNKKIKSQGTLCTFVMNLYPSSFRRLFCAVFSSSMSHQLAHIKLVLLHTIGMRKRVHVQRSSLLGARTACTGLVAVNTVRICAQPYIHTPYGQ